VSGCGNEIAEEHSIRPHLKMLAQVCLSFLLYFRLSIILIIIQLGNFFLFIVFETIMKSSALPT